MTAPYDSYDYVNYWQGREYEHKSENTAIRYLLDKIPYIDKILEVGGGFGRLVPIYAYRAKKVTLTDSSVKILNIAKKNLKNEKKIEFVQSSLENLPNKFRKRSFDLIVMVRVLHHIKNAEKAFKIISSLLKSNGYFILEFPNKNHFKANAQEILKGNFEFLSDPKPIDIRGAKSIRAKSIAFFNYNPRFIQNKLMDSGFEIIETLSVSNIRSPYIKKYISIETLITIEKLLQKPFSFLNFGPSIFVLAKKRP